MVSISRSLRRSLAPDTLHRLLLQSRAFVTAECHRPVVLHKRGPDILHDPWFNRGTAFSMTERDRLGLRGLLPPSVVSSQQQIDRFSDGKIGHSNQENNMYLFPGIGLGTLLSGARIISDGMLQAAAERLASYMKEEEVLQGIIYPQPPEYVTSPRRLQRQ